MNMLTKNDFYFCYSSKLSKYLNDKGFHYLFMAKDCNRNNPFSLYYKTPELLQALDEYKTNN